LNYPNHIYQDLLSHLTCKDTFDGTEESPAPIIFGSEVAVKHEAWVIYDNFSVACPNLPVMNILFIFYCLFLHDDVVAAPLLDPILHPMFEIEINPSKFVQRSTWSIIWSCLSTVSLCLWVVVHPNIPGPSESMFLARLKIMGCMLIAPELVIVWAARQWFAARDIANKHKGVPFDLSIN
jgi:hypothetical protein